MSRVFDRFRWISDRCERIENGNRGIESELRTKLKVLKCGKDDLFVVFSESEGSIVNGRSVSEDELG